MTTDSFTTSPALSPTNDGRSKKLTVAMLLSCDTFDAFFQNVLGFDHEQYVAKYRHDFSWYYGMGLLKNGVTPIIYIPSMTHDARYQTDVGVDVRFVKCESWYRAIIPIRRACRITRWTRYLQERVNAAAFIESLKRDLVEDDVDVLYLQEYWGGRFDHLVHRMDIPVTAADHGGLAQGVFNGFKKRAFDSASTIYSQTDVECQDVRRHGGSSILLPNGIDTQYFSPPPADAIRNKTILTVARLTDKQKRTSDLIRAMKHLGPDWRLDIVGTGPDKRMLEELAASLGIAGQVHFLGFQSRDEVRTYVRRCGVYAMPSSNEGMPIAALEAMGCGAAIVATQIPAFEALIKDGVNGLLVPVGDPVTLASAIEKAWDGRQALGVNASITISDRFDSEKLLCQLADTMRAAAISKKMKTERPSDSVKRGEDFHCVEEGRLA